MNDNVNDTTAEHAGGVNELAQVENSEPDQAAPEPKDGEVPPSGALPPDPTGLGELA